MQPDLLVRRYQDTYGRIRDDTSQRVGLAWDRLGGPTDEHKRQFLSTALPLMQGAQHAVVHLVSGYMETMARQYVGGRSVPTVRIATVTGQALRGVAPEEVYSRPVVALRIFLSEGKAYEDAFRQASRRAITLARTDLALAQRAVTNALVASDDRFRGYSRVLSGTCSFCAKVAAQHYGGSDMPLHDNCDCSVAPVLKTREPLRHDDNKAAVEWGQKAWGETPLSSDELDALKRYGEGAYSGINRQLRAGAGLRPETRETVRHMDAALKRQRVPEDVVVWRRVGLDAFQKLPDELVGQTLKEKGYLSTSVGNGPAGSGSGLAQSGAIMEIRVPAGTPAYFQRNIAAARYKGERELLLGRDLKYVVKEAKYSRGRWRLVVEVVP